MQIKVETEKKYYCLEPERLIKIAEQNGFKLVDKANESDEYFTDINSEFIKNRTCLRIRKRNNEKLLITYKGKSNSLLGLYCKLENNIQADVSEYSNYVSLFSSLGYYSYVEVIKERITYTLKNATFEYSIMIDNLPEIGGFVEFEILSHKENAGKNELKQELNRFVSLFDSLNLKEVMQPYRDIVADFLFKQTVSNTSITDMYINIDNEIFSYEKNFFKRYKDKISEICGSNIKWGEYKKNKSLDNKIVAFIDEYFDNLIFDSNELLVTIELLKRLNYKKHFITKTNELFFTHLFAKLNIEIEDIIFIQDDSITKILKNSQINCNNSIIIDEKDFKKVNSLLLIMINNQ